MLDPKKIQQLEQSLSEMRETLPALYRSLYEGCLDQGFTEDQSLKLVIALIQRPTENQ